MQAPQLRVKSLANDLTVPHNDRTHERIRADAPPPPLRKPQSPPQVLPIRACELGFHEVD